VGDLKLRVFVGPNGSGKSTLLELVAAKFNVGFVINADEIEAAINKYGIYKLVGDFPKINVNLLNAFVEGRSKGEKGTIRIDNEGNIASAQKINSYQAAGIADYLRDLCTENNVRYCFESVFSHPAKLEDLRKAKNKGYEVYLYFICLDSPELNIKRVSSRVLEGGHFVPDDKIIDRYARTLALLPELLLLASRAFIFDNSKSSERFKLIASKKRNSDLLDLEPLSEYPTWFINALSLNG
jgi:predicted ABC-type ATPase